MPGPGVERSETTGGIGRRAAPPLSGVVCYGSHLYVEELLGSKSSSPKPALQ